MANNLIQVKRTSVSGRAANSTTLPNPGELALNMTDGILYSTNGSTVFEIGANNTNARVSGTLTVNAVSANGGVGANNQKLTSNGSIAYWKDPLIKDLTDVAANGATDTQVLTYNSTLQKWINQNPPVANVIYTTGYYGVFYDTTTQYATGGSNTSTVTKLANTFLTNGVTRTANNELQVAYSGVYKITYSLQFTSSANKNEFAYVWLRKNGTDVPDSSTDFGIYPISGVTNGFMVAVTSLVDDASAGDKFQIMWATSDNSAVSMVYLANSAFAPETPSAIVDVVPISNIITAPPGGNTDVTFNDSGLANGAAGFTYNKTTNSVFIANNLNVGNTVNAQVFSVGGTFTANSTGVNAASFKINTDFSANSTMVNAAALLVRGGATVNGQLTLNDGLSANGGLGTTGQVLFTDGSKAYWNSASFGGGGSVNVDAQYVWTNTQTFQNTVTFGNSTVNATVNSTFFTGTANNTSFVGSVSAANIVSNAQLSGNLSNYQTTAGLSANVATLTSNNATHAFGKTEGNLNVNSAVNSNNTTYAYGKTEGNLNVNSAVNSNNSTFAYGKTEGNLNVNNATTAYGKTEANLNVNSAVFANNSTYAFGKSEGQLNVNSAVNANSSAYAYGKTEDNLNVNSAFNANNSTHAFGKTEGNLNVNNALTANYASYVNANTGVISNSSGVFVNSTYIATISSNNASYLGGVLAASYVQNTDSRILSGNINFTGTNNYFTTALYVNNAVVNSSGIYATNLNGNLTGNVVANVISGNLTGNVTATTISGNLTGNVVATTVNTATLNATANIVVGSNVLINTSVVSIGNSTANVYVNSTAFVGNVSATSISGNLSGNVTATSISGNLTGNVTATTISGNLTAITANVTNKLQIGTPGAFDFGSNAVIEIDANGNTYVQSVIQNANTGNNASADLVVTNDTGNDSFNYVDLGINGSNYNQPGYNISGQNDAYLYASDGNLTIGTKAAKEVVFHANGTTTTDRRLTINATAVTIANAAALVVNSSSGTAGQILTSNSTGVYWSSSANNALNLGGTAAASYQLNSTLNANIASYLPTYTGTVNASVFQVGTNFVANSTQVTAADLLVTGNLIVNGTTVTLNTATLDVKDLNITLAKGTASAAAANGAGITVDAANATLLYINAGNTWLSNVNFGVGNSTSNVSINSTAFVGNVVATRVTANLTGNVTATTITGNLTGNVAAVTITGNLTGNVAAVTITGNLTGNVIATTISGNLTGNVIATTISGNLTGNVVATTVNTTTMNATSNVIVGANVTLNASSLAIGNSTHIATPQIIVANTTGTTTINAGTISTTSITGNLTGNVAAVTITGNLTGNVAAVTISGNLTGNVAAVTITGNLTGNVAAVTITGNLTGNVSSTTTSASANVTVGANVLINTSAIVVSNSTAVTRIDAVTVLVGNSTITAAPQILVQNSTGGATINPGFIVVGANVVANLTAHAVLGNSTTAPTSILTGAALNIGNTTITGAPQVIVANTLGTTTINSNIIAVGGNVVANLTAHAVLGNNTTAPTSILTGAALNIGNTSIIGAPQVVVANTTGTTTINSNIITVGGNVVANLTAHAVLGNSTTAPTSVLTGAALNIGNTSIIGAPQVIVANSTGNVIVNASSIAISNATVAGSFTANATVVNAVSYYAGTLLVANTTVINATHLGGKTEGNLNVNSAASLTSNANFMTNRGSVAAASVDTAIENGFYTQTNPGDSQGILTFNTGGSLGPLQMTFTYTGVFQFRNKTDSLNWTAYKTVLTNANFNTYSPTLTGTGASGTWGINVTGTAYGKAEAALNVNNATTAYGKTEGNLNVNNATTAYGKTEGNLNVNNATTAYGKTEGNLNVNNASYAFNYTQGFNSNWNTDFSSAPAGSMILRGDTSTGSSTGGPGGTWWFQQNFRHTNSANVWGTQVAWGWEDNANILRTRNVTSGTYGAWVTYLNSSNYNSYAPTLTGTGASGTWSINVTGTAYGKAEAALNVNNATTAYGKTEGNLNVNSALYANASISNTFTVGTGSYFVSNGNVGIGNTAPGEKLHVAGAIVSSGITSLAKTSSVSLDFNTASGSSRILSWGNTSTNGLFGIWTGNNSAATERVRVDVSGNVGIGTTAPAYKLEVNGSFAATTKSFVIDHPSRPGMKLRYASLEGPENGVYVRGRTNSTSIELPDYWRDLVDEESITVNLTAIGSSQDLYVMSVNSTHVEVNSQEKDYFFAVFAERKDVDKLVVEF